MRLPLHLLIALAIAGCGTGGGGAGSVSASLPVVAITGGSATVSQPGPFDLTIGGPTTSVTIAPNQQVHDLTAGGGGQCWLGASSSISGTVQLTGSFTLHVPAGFTFVGSVSVGGTARIVYDSLLSFAG